MDIKTIWKGFLVGISMMIPGVSGGTMSIILGIYDRLISSVSSFMKHKKESFLFLFQFALGGGTAFLFLSGPMASLTRRFPMETAFFVVGAILGGVPVIFKKAKTETLSFSCFLYFFAGFFLVFLTGNLPENLFHGGGNGLFSVLIQIAAGILGALALILPGISFSSMLYMMGVYKTVFSAIGNREFLLLFPFTAGCIIGIVFLTKLLEKAMNEHPTPTYFIILGFVTGSVIDILKELPYYPEAPAIIFYVIFSCIGFFLIRFLARWES